MSSPGPFHRIGTVLATMVSAFLWAGPLHAATIEGVRLSPDALAPACSPIEGEYPVSIQAATFYATGATLMKGLAPADKGMQSFACAGEKSTLYYYAYPDPQVLDQAQAFAKPFIWGDRRSSMHPEFIMPIENVLIVISSRHAEYFAYAFFYGVPGDAGPDVGKSIEAYRARDYKKAEKGLRSFSESKPDLVVGHLYLGHTLYYQQKYHDAIPAYERVLDLGAKGAALGRYNDKVVTDNLGIAYALDGHLDKSKALFEAAIKRDPDYPMSYYNLACTEAELGDLDAALANLKLGYARRDKMLPGEPYPDPRTDDSFKKYLSDAKFQAAMKEMGY